MLWCNACASIVTVFRGNFVEVCANDVQDALRIGEDIFKLGNGCHELLVLFLNLEALKGCQAAQLHVQNGLSLLWAEVETFDQSCFGNVGVW